MAWNGKQADGSLDGKRTALPMDMAAPEDLFSDFKKSNYLNNQTKIIDIIFFNSGFNLNKLGFQYQHLTSRSYK